MTRLPLTLRNSYKASIRCLSTATAIPNSTQPLKNSELPTLASTIVSTPNSSLLTDTFGRKHTYLRISLTEKCNLRCVYCMPDEGVQLTPNDKLLTNTEIARLLQLFVDAGVTKLRLTGGEPLVRKDINEIISAASQTISTDTRRLESIGLTTNGIVLSRKLPSLITAGLTHINISLDTLDPFKFQIIARRLGFEQVVSAIDNSLAAKASNQLQSVKLNCVIMRGVNDAEILDFIEFTRDRDLDVRFIEYMPFDGNRWSDSKFVPYQEMISKIVEKFPTFIKLPPTDPHDTSKMYHVPGFVGRVGFITSMSEHFCDSCNRLRITADGNLKVCLFGATEVNVREAIRNGASDEELRTIINAAVLRKKARHADTSSFIPIEQNAFSAYSPSHNHRLVSYPRNLIQRMSLNDSMNTSLFPLHSSHPSFLNARMFSTESTGLGSRDSGLSHIDQSTGQPTMVDVSEKRITVRVATAQTTILLPPALSQFWNHSDVNSPHSENVKDIMTKKGPVLSTAIIAGTMAVKRTSDLIPFCHPIPIESIKFRTSLVPYLSDEDKKIFSIRSYDSCASDESHWRALQIECTVKCSGKTGVEMEALTGCSVAALTFYDMCKALTHSMVIFETKLLQKSGGKSDFVVKDTKKKA